jgi:ribokinase
MVTNQGADFDLCPEQLPDEALRAAGHIHLTGWSIFTDPPRAAALRAAQIAKAAGATVSFDPASYQMIREMGNRQFERLIAELPIDILFPNRDEGAILSGEREPEAIAQALQERFKAAIVVLKLDRDGCYVLADGRGAYYPSTLDQAVDATGAGDAFDAAFLARCLGSGDLDVAARYANAVGGWTVNRYGARPPLDDELRQILLQGGAPHK